MRPTVWNTLLQFFIQHWTESTSIFKDLYKSFIDKHYYLYLPSTTTQTFCRFEFSAFFTNLFINCADHSMSIFRDFQDDQSSEKAEVNEREDACITRRWLNFTSIYNEVWTLCSITLECIKYFEVSWKILSIFIQFAFDYIFF